MATETEAGLTRSRLVKRAAIVGGAAIAWSTPFVTSASAADSATAAHRRAARASARPAPPERRPRASSPGPDRERAFAGAEALSRFYSAITLRKTSAATTFGVSSNGGQTR